MGFAFTGRTRAPECGFSGSVNGTRDLVHTTGHLMVPPRRVGEHPSGSTLTSSLDVALHGQAVQ